MSALSRRLAAPRPEKAERYERQIREVIADPKPGEVIWSLSDVEIAALADGLAQRDADRITREVRA